MTNKDFISKSKLISIVAKKIGVPISMTGQVVSGCFEAIEEALCNREIVKIAGFGKFEARKRHARKGVNPQNPSEIIQIPEIMVPKFSAGKPLKDNVKGK